MIPKGTQPNTRNWIQCEGWQFKAALVAMRDAGITYQPSMLYNQMIYSDSEGMPIARHYTYRKSHRYLVAVSMQEYVPEARRINTTEGSIYV